MSNDAHGGSGDGNGANLGKIPHEALIDRLELTLDRGDGTMKISGCAINLDVGLDMCQRGVRFFETQLRIQAVGVVKQQQADQARVNDLLNRTRGGRG
jgi:hypothetical protein